MLDHASEKRRERLRERREQERAARAARNRVEVGQVWEIDSNDGHRFTFVVEALEGGQVFGQVRGSGRPVMFRRYTLETRKRRATMLLRADGTAPEVK